MGEARGKALGSAVPGVNLAWQPSKPKAAEVADTLEFVRTDDVAREELPKPTLC